MTTTRKIETVTFADDTTVPGYGVVYAGTYRVEMPSDYDASEVTAHDVIEDGAMRFVAEGEEEDARAAAIKVLTSTTLGEDIGLGAYTAIAAYKSANGDIHEGTPGLSDEIRAALRACPDITWDEAGA